MFIPFFKSTYGILQALNLPQQAERICKMYIIYIDFAYRRKV